MIKYAQVVIIVTSIGNILLRKVVILLSELYEIVINASMNKVSEMNLT